MNVTLPRHLLGERQNALDRTEVHEDVARVLALLDDAGDDVPLPALEVAEDLLVLEVSEALHDDLARRRGGDPTEADRGVVELGPRLAPLWPLAFLGRKEVALLAGPDDDVTGLAVELDPGAAVAALGAVVGDEEGLLDGGDEHIEADPPLPLEGPECGKVDVHQFSSSGPAGPASMSAS